MIGLQYPWPRYQSLSKGDKIGPYAIIDLDLKRRSTVVYHNRKHTVMVSEFPVDGTTVPSPYETKKAGFTELTL